MNRFFRTVFALVLISLPGRVAGQQTVVIDTLSHQGMNSAAGPVDYFGKAGIRAEDVLKDAVDVHDRVQPGGAGCHIITGPIYVEGAEPGDQLEVRVLDV